MGQRAKRAKSHRSRHSSSPPPLPPPPPPPPPGTSCIDIAKWLGHYGIILVLFETPSGFALFHYDGVKLFHPKAMENIWADFIDDTKASEAVDLKEFQNFEDKASAISSAGVGDKLAKMIKKCSIPGQKLAVGKVEYQEIIQKTLGIHCLFDDAVKELMWGLKNLMKFLVPREELELAAEDRLHMSGGMKLILDRYGLEVEAEMVNPDIINVAATIFEFDFRVNKHTDFLCYGGEKLKEVSQIDTLNWDPLKVATALKLIACPGEDISTGGCEELISPDMKQKLADAVDQYKGKLNMKACLAIYKDIAMAYKYRRRALDLLTSLIKEAKEELKLHQGC